MPLVTLIIIGNQEMTIDILMVISSIAASNVISIIYLWRLGYLEVGKMKDIEEEAEKEETVDEI